MMSAEENSDTDIELDLDDDDAVCVAPSSSNNIESPVFESVSPPVAQMSSPPVKPMSTRNLIQTNDVIDGRSSENIDGDKIIETGCLSSDSSQSESSVLVSPFKKKLASGSSQCKNVVLLPPVKKNLTSSSSQSENAVLVSPLRKNLASGSSQSENSVLVSPLQKNLASGLFENDKSEDLFSVVASNTDITSSETTACQQVNTVASNLKSTFIKSNYATSPSSAVSLFSSDKNTDDFLKAPDVKSPLPLQAKPYGVKASQQGSNNASPYSLTNTLPTCSIYDNNNANNWKMPIHSNIPNYSSPIRGAPTQLQSATSLVTTPIGGATASPFAFHRETELPRPRNETHYSNISENSNPHIHNYSSNSPCDNQQKSHLNFNNLNIENNESKQYNTCNTPLLYNPSNLPQAPVFGGNLHNTGDNLHNTTNEMYCERNKSNDYLQVTSSISNVTNKETTDAAKNDNSPLFIPQMYCNTTQSNAPSYFVPEQVSDNNFMQPSHFIPPPSHVNNNVSPPTYEESISPERNHFDISPLGYHGRTRSGSQGERGILEWLKDTVIKDWPAGANNLRKYMKTATDSVLTTLDPGMRDYLEPGMHIGVATQSISMLVGIKEGFTNALHAVPNIQGHSMNTGSTILLPVGFERALQATYDHLEYLSSVKFDFPGEYILISSQVFLTELVSGKWYIMYCLGLQGNIVLHTFSQPIPLPFGCINASYNQMLQNETGDCIGYNIAIDEVVKRHIAYEKDWCLALTGIPLHKIIATAVQCLALDYQRHVATKNNASRLETYSENVNYSNTSRNNYPHRQNQYSVSLDAFS